MLVMLLHVPPLTQGLEEQSENGTSQTLPVNPSGHTHINVSATMQVPPF